MKAIATFLHQKVLVELRCRETETVTETVIVTGRDRYGFLLESCSIYERLLEGYYQRRERWPHSADYRHPRRAPQGKSSLLVVCVLLIYCLCLWKHTRKMHSWGLKTDPTSTRQACLSGGLKDVYKTIRKLKEEEEEKEEGIATLNDWKPISLRHWLLDTSMLCNLHYVYFVYCISFSAI